MRKDFDIRQVAGLIDWLYFYHAWGVKEGQDERLIDDARRLLDQWEGRVQTHALLLTAECRGEDDDIVLADGRRIPLLRQQRAGEGRPFLCLSDFVNPAGDSIGIFCCTCDAAIEGDDYTRMLRQTVADRLAEATAELVHRQSGMGGIRPAVGYPSLPDQSLNFLLDSILGFGRIGVRLTENGAMMPHASVSGLIIGHPAARYFSIGAVAEDQLDDYARRRGVEKYWIRKFLNI